jgi:hypothetical protein
MSNLHDLRIPCIGKVSATIDCRRIPSSEYISDGFGEVRTP